VVPGGRQAQALCDLADEMLAGTPTSVAHAILRRDLSRVRAGAGPADGRFVGGYEAICEWAPHLDRSYVPIQGPPGTGKTFTGAHVIRTLVEQGRRVGVTAMSHQAIDNLMQAVVDRFTEEVGDSEPESGAQGEERPGRRRAVRRRQRGAPPATTT
jgi:Cdc6-like AAA superfamily ATPase